MQLSVTPDNRNEYYREWKRVHRSKVKEYAMKRHTIEVEYNNMIKNDPVELERLRREIMDS